MVIMQIVYKNVLFICSYLFKRLQRYMNIRDFDYSRHRKIILNLLIWCGIIGYQTFQKLAVYVIPFQ